MAVGHFIIFLIGLYLVGVSIYNVIKSGTQDELIINTLSAAIGGGLALYGGYRFFTKEKKSEGKGQSQGQQGQRQS